MRLYLLRKRKFKRRRNCLLKDLPIGNVGIFIILFVRTRSMDGISMLRLPRRLALKQSKEVKDYSKVFWERYEEIDGSYPLP